MKWIMLSKHTKIISLALFTTAALSSSPVVLAKHCKKHHCKKYQHVTIYKDAYKDMTPAVPMYTFTPNWYVGGHIGVSRTHDKPAPASSNSVTQIGPGWTVDLGYQFVQFYKIMFAGELGYTQYHNSNETTPTTNVASTEHFASYLAAVAQYPIINKFSIFGKLGVAYSYAKKVFTGGGSASANDYSPYYGAGFGYNITPQAELDLQWARARGNNKTGSTDLTSLGLTYHFM